MDRVCHWLTPNVRGSVRTAMTGCELNRHHALSGVCQTETRSEYGHGPVWERATHWVRQAYPDGSMSPVSKVRGTGPARSSRDRPRIRQGSLVFCGLVAPRCRCFAWLPPEHDRRPDCRSPTTTLLVQAPMQTGRSKLASTGPPSMVSPLLGLPRPRPTALHQRSTECRPPAGRRIGAGALKPRRARP